MERPNQFLAHPAHITPGPVNTLVYHVLLAISALQLPINLLNVSVDTTARIALAYLKLVL